MTTLILNTVTSTSAIILAKLKAFGFKLIYWGEEFGRARAMSAIAMHMNHLTEEQKKRFLDNLRNSRNS